MTSVNRVDVCEEEKWNAAIKERLGTTKHRLLFDYSTSGEVQKKLLHNILFVDSTSVKHWSAYIRYVANKEDNHASICRLFNDIFPVLDNPANYNDTAFVELYLFKAQYFGLHNKDPRRVLREMKKKGIGCGHPSFIQAWKEMESMDGSGSISSSSKPLLRSNTNDDVRVTSKATGKENVSYDKKEDKADTTCSKLDKECRDNGGSIASAVVSRPGDTTPVQIDQPPLLDSQYIKRNSDKIAGRSRPRLGMPARVLPGESTTSAVSVQEKNSALNDSVVVLQSRQKRSKDIETSSDSDCNTETNCESTACLTAAEVTKAQSNEGNRIDRVNKSSVLNTTVTKKSSTQPPNDASDELVITLKESNNKRSHTRHREAYETSVEEGKKRVSFAGGDTERESKSSNVDDSVASPPRAKARRSSRSKVAEKVSTPEDDEIQISLKPAKKVYSSSAFLDSCKEVVVENKKYIQLGGTLGRGASSSVRRVVSLKTGDLYAYKRVDIRSSCVDDAEEVFESYANEINLLKQCKGSDYIIDLIASEVNKNDMFVAMVMEMGEVDLATSISHQKKAYASSHPNSSKVNPFYMRMVWERMLLAVDHIHEHRIVHGDLKPANFVFVRGELKLIDFGISKEISSDTTNIVRHGLIGTVNYMAPEAVMPSVIPPPECSDDDNDQSAASGSIIKHGRASDIWSLGCILYQMLYGKTPFASFRNTHQKVAMITNPKADIQFPVIDEQLGVDAARRCLVRDVSKRAPIRGENGLLCHPFLTAHHEKESSLNRPESSPQSQRCTTRSSSTQTSEKKTMQSDTETDCSSTCNQFLVSDLVEKVLQCSTDIRDGRMQKSKLCNMVSDMLSAPNRVNMQREKASGLDASVIPHIISSENFRAKEPSKEFTRQPLQRLPQSLKEEIQFQKPEQTTSVVNDENQGRLRLRGLKHSDHTKWIRPKGQTPDKKDMKSVLEKRLGVMRQFLCHDTDDTIGSTFDLQDELSFTNF